MGLIQACSQRLLGKGVFLFVMSWGNKLNLGVETRDGRFPFPAGNGGGEGVPAPSNTLAARPKWLKPRGSGGAK